MNEIDSPITARDIVITTDENPWRVMVQSQLRMTVQLPVEQLLATLDPKSIDFAKRDCRKILIKKIYDKVRSDAYIAFNKLRKRAINFQELGELEEVFKPLINVGKELE